MYSTSIFYPLQILSAHLKKKHPHKVHLIHLTYVIYIGLSSHAVRKLLAPLHLGLVVSALRLQLHGVSFCVLAAMTLTSATYLHLQLSHYAGLLPSVQFVPLLSPLAQKVVAVHHDCHGQDQSQSGAGCGSQDRWTNHYHLDGEFNSLEINIYKKD